MDGITHLAEDIAAELQRLLPRQRKTQRVNLALLVATMLTVRSANLMDLAAGLPRAADRIDMRFQWIWRVLMNPLIAPDDVMSPFAGEVMRRVANEKKPIVLIMDGLEVNGRRQILMLALRVGGRTLPVLWRVEDTAGDVGFAAQKALLEAVVPILPNGAQICLAVDRLRSSMELVTWCQNRKWDYRIRLKGDLVIRDEDEWDVTAELAEDYIFALENVVLADGLAAANIGVAYDPERDESWLVATPAEPGYLKTQGYSWQSAIEPMFSDFGSRGFGLESSQIRYPDRLSRLLLVMALALYFRAGVGGGKLMDDCHSGAR